MGMVTEFKEFIVKGNMVDMAVGIIIGAAFGTLVKSLVDDVIMPPIGYAMGGIDFSNLFVALNGEEYTSLAVAQEAGAPTINYGLFINNCLSLLIVGFAVFMLVKAVNKLQRKAEEKPEAPVEPPKEQVLLEEIRDLMAAQQQKAA